MTITQDTLVADIATAIPSSVRVFERYGVDFCCGGRRTLAAACEERHLPFDRVAKEIAAAAASPSGECRDWTREPLHALADHIVATYHEKLREDLPRLERMASRVRGVHGGRDPVLLETIESIVGELSADL